MSISQWKRFKRGDCPVCAGQKNDCRQSLNSGAIFCRSGQEQSGDWSLVNLDKHGFGIYRHSSQSSPEAQQQLAEQRETWKRQERERLAGLLPNEERSWNYLQIARASGLATPERNELRQRGLTDAQIDWAHQQSFISSWVHGSCSSLGLNAAVAGVGPKGLTGYTGLAIFFHDAAGNAVGGQVRPRSDQARENAKYPWISSVSKGGNGPQLQTGKLPLAVWQHPQLDPTQPVQVEACEGGLKSLLVALRYWEGGNHQTIVIGAAGGLFEGLADVLATFPTAQSFTLHPDAGAQDNPHLRRNYEAAIAQAPSLNPQLSWWGQTSKDKHSDIDELSPEQLQTVELISLAAWLELGTVSQESDRHRHSFQQRGAIISRELWEAQQPLHRLMEGLQWVSQGISSLIPLSQALPTQQDDCVQVADQSEGYQLAKASGARLIVNTLGTGSGKTHHAAQMQPQDWNADRLMLVLIDALNVSIPELTSWALLQGGHHGTVRDENDKLKRATLDTPKLEKESPANCDKATAKQALAQKRSTIDPCFQCKFLQLCKTRSGDGFGRRHQAQVAWKSERIRTSYGRIPMGEELVSLIDAVLILDESSSRVETTESVSINHDDLNAKFRQAAGHPPQLFRQIEALLNWLADEQYRNHPQWDSYYGVVQAQIVDPLRSLCKDIDLAALADLEDDSEERQLFNLDAQPMDLKRRSRLNRLRKKQEPIAEVEHAWGIAEAAYRDGDKSLWPAVQAYRRTYLSIEERRELAELEREAQEKAKQHFHGGELLERARRLTKRWLGDFVAVAMGEQPGHIAIASNGDITLTLENRRHLDAIQAAKVTILLDASESRSKAVLSEKYGIPEDEIFIFGAPVLDHGNLTTIQVTGLGSMGKQRGEGLEKCKQALVAELKRLEPTHIHFDHKGLERDARLFVDSVGSNDFKTCKSISAVPPRPSLGAALAEYCTRKGQIVSKDDAGFQDYYQRRVAEQIRQWLGRLRANLRPDEQLTAYLLTDQSMPFDFDLTMRASQITTKAARKGERAILAIANAAQWVTNQGQELTQSAVARASKLLEQNNGKGYARQQIQRLWGEVTTRVQLFLLGRTKKSCTPQQADRITMAAMALNELVAAPDDENLLFEIFDCILHWTQPEDLPYLRVELCPLAVDWVVRALSVLLPEEWRSRCLRRAGHFPGLVYGNGS